MPASTERAFIATPIATAGPKVIASPFQFWSSGEDNLRVTSVCAVSGVALKVQARFITPDGTISAASWDHTPNSDRTTKSDEYPLSPGAVLSLVVYARTGTLQSGQCFVIMQLIRGRGAAATLVGVLLAGYVTTTQAIAWPGSPVVRSTDGEPAIRAITGTQPALAAAISETVPTGARWELLTVWFVVSTNTTLTGGTPVFTINGSGIRIGKFPAQQPIPNGGTSAELSWLAGFTTPVTATSSVITTSLPLGLRLPAGSEFDISNGFAGYQYGAPNYLVREWLEVP